MKNSRIRTPLYIIYSSLTLIMLLLARSTAINHLLPKIILERKLKLTILQNPRMIKGITILCNTKTILPETKTIKCDVDGSFSVMVPRTRTQSWHADYK